MPELIPAEPGTPEWLAARRLGVTATDIVTILGLSSWDSVYSLFWRKLGQVPETPDSDRFRLGRELEPYVADRWAEANGGRIPLLGALYRSTVRPWQMATLDRRTETMEPVELKTWADADKQAWRHAGSAGMPPSVRAQVLWQMDVVTAQAESARFPDLDPAGAQPGPAYANPSRGHVGVVFLPSGEFRSYTIEHAENCEPCINPCEVCGDIDLMRDAGEEFMGRLRLELPPPDPDASAATLAAVRARFTPQPAKQADIDGNLWRAWSDAKNCRDFWDETCRDGEIKLREQAGEASVLTVDGQPVARRVISGAQVKAHTRHQDYIRRIAREEETGGSADSV